MKGKNARAWLIGALLIAGLAILTVGIYASQAGRESVARPEEVIGTINGEPVAREMFDLSVALPALVSRQLGQAPPVVSKQQALDQLMNDVLLAQAAREAGFQVSADDLNGEIALFLASIGTNRDGFEPLLQEEGISWGTFEEFMANSVLIGQYVNNELLVRIMDVDQEAFLRSWLLVRNEQSEINFEVDFLNEVYE